MRTSLILLLFSLAFAHGHPRLRTVLDPFQLPFVQRGLLEVLLLSIPAGLLGTWIVLRGLAFFSHAVGTAAFPGLVLADGLGFAAPLGAFGAAIAFGAAASVLERRRPGGYRAAARQQDVELAARQRRPGGGGGHGRSLALCEDQCTSGRDHGDPVRSGLCLGRCGADAAPAGRARRDFGGGRGARIRF